ncbi:MAG TPA: RHS repeat-associated core domain-containing protein [Candidatus Acidoferrales bacterium]|nr:RHS repeat-associated core domain-containing protein [Candidatus Acidoferrales bacterium]
MGTKTITYFHQSGGRDNSALGEYLDQGSESKKGRAFRTEVIGSDGTTNKVTLNKVEEVMLNTNGWFFPFVSQIIVMNYEGLNSYRATARQTTYDTNTENITMTANLGEVTNVVFQGQSFTDIGNDSVYSWISYATNLAGILDKPSDIKNTSDSAGTVRLRETELSYNSHGQMTNTQVWLNTAGMFVTAAANIYDQYGNLVQSTDPAGVTTSTGYDTNYEQFPTSITTGTFTDEAVYDVRSGMVIQSTDAKGLVSSNTYDVFYRPIAEYVSTNAFGNATLWEERKYYSLGGITNGISYNFTLTQVNDDVNGTNGYQTYTFSDGLGRGIETRAEAENSQYRIANTVYDDRGVPYYQTIPYFSSGTNYTVLVGTNLGVLSEYDKVGRVFRLTPAEQAVFNSSGQLQSITATGGDANSPVGPTTTAFVDGNNPWATIVTDARGKIKKSSRDAYNRLITVTEVTSNENYTTSYSYDLLGSPTNVTDSAGNSTSMAYDSLGRKTSMIDADMGAWNYVFDNAGRLTQQLDAKTNKIVFSYSDPLGRLTSKQIYGPNNQLTGTVSYIYDSSDDTNFTVYKGQLYEVIDLQGYERNSYDIRGRVLQSGRYLNLNAMEYITQAAYDDADRLQQLIYPGNAATIQYSYDTGGNLTQVKSVAGTGTNEVFYTAGSFNAVGQLLSYTNGNGVVTSNTFYPNSQRQQRVQVVSGTSVLQDLSYTYDAVSDLGSVYDGVHAGAASASLSNIVYDDFNRLTSVTSAANGTRTYAYNSIGNMLTNHDFGSGLYTYGSRPHAVTNANGTAYAYDTCGNMTTRGGQTLMYDAQNQLAGVSGPGLSVSFGYDDDGERLWRNGTNGYTIWIGGIYEINNGRILCHVLADGALVATFEPQCNALMSKVFGEKRWYLASNALTSIADWPFQNGRSPFTMLIGIWAAIIGICFAARRSAQIAPSELRRNWRQPLTWKRAVTVISLSAYFLTTTNNAQAATYSPVFYYYHGDHLGSSNVLTDRSGNQVQHYEYSSFGQTSFADNSSAFPVSNRYTGQIADDETGLYYYGARYYDPQLGRFIQPDSDVGSPDNPQNLNRYSYCGNNPLNCMDPTGHNPFVIALIFILAGAAIGASVSAATGGNPAMGALGGAVAGLIAFGGYAAAPEIGALLGMTAKTASVVVDAAAGAAGGAASAAIQGGNVGMAALIGGVAGGIFGYLDPPDISVTAQQDSGETGGFSAELHVHLPHTVTTTSAESLSPGQASAATGTVAAAAGGISEPNFLQSSIPVVGSAWESAHYFSTGHPFLGTTFAAFAILDLTGVGELGDVALKGALRVAAKGEIKATVEEAGRYVVYQGIDKATGTVKYVGITSRTVAVRGAEHAAAKEGKELLRYEAVKGANNLTKMQARVYEQNLINRYGLQGEGQLLNKINSIDEKYWAQHGIKR